MVPYAHALQFLQRTVESRRLWRVQTDPVTNGSRLLINLVPVWVVPNKRRELRFVKKEGLN